MKLQYIFAMLILASCGGKKEAQPIQENDPTPAQILITRLQNVVDSGKYIYGHADDTAYGHDWEYKAGRSDVKETAGDYPGLINWDLGMIELDSANNLDGVPFLYMANEIKNQNERGGINSISWHPRNPVTMGDSWDVSDTLALRKVLQSGTETNIMVKEWIGKAADFIGNLKDSKGNLIPVIFRPWHEHTGNWFWWGVTNSTPEEYKQLWQMTREIFDEKGVSNVVWAYSPDRVRDENQYMERYPGDEFVDLMGIDIYQYGTENGVETYQTALNTGLGVAAKVAKEHNKLMALTETGSEGIPIDDWHIRVLASVIDAYPIAYVLVWRNALQETKPGHFYAPFPGHPAAEDFIIFYNKPKTLFSKDLKNNF